MRVFALFCFALFAAGCGFVYDQHIVGPYRVFAVDVMQGTSVGYESANGTIVTRIHGPIYAYGYNLRYIVAARYAAADKSTSEYFVLDMAKDSEYAESSASVSGPITREEFDSERARLNLPELSVTISELK